MKMDTVVTEVQSLKQVSECIPDENVKNMFDREFSRYNKSLVNKKDTLNHRQRQAGLGGWRKGIRKAFCRRYFCRPHRRAF